MSVMYFGHVLIVLSCFACTWLETSGCGPDRYYDPITGDCHPCSDCSDGRTPNVYCNTGCKGEAVDMEMLLQLDERRLKVGYCDLKLVKVTFSTQRTLVCRRCCSAELVFVTLTSEYKWYFRHKAFRIYSTLKLLKTITKCCVLNLTVDAVHIY